MPARRLSGPPQSTVRDPTAGDVPPTADTVPIDPLTRIDHPLVRSAAQAVAVAWIAEPALALDKGEVLEVLAAVGGLIVAALEDEGETPTPRDQRTGSLLGRRLLELLREQLLESDAAPAERLELLQAVERVRRATEPNWSQYFAQR